MLWVILAVFAVVVARMLWESKQDPKDLAYGPLNLALICPHCQQKGQVRTKWVDEVAGVSGPKAAGAIATGGLSMLVTGLARKRQVTRAHCGACASTWSIG